MGLFGPPKIKITPHDFVKAELDRIFSPQSADTETNEFTRLSRDNPILRAVSPGTYLRERHNVIASLFQIAWDRSIPYSLFIEYASIIHDDPRVKAVYTGAYDRVLSRAREAGMDTLALFRACSSVTQAATASAYSSSDASNAELRHTAIDREREYVSIFENKPFGIPLTAVEQQELKAIKTDIAKLTDETDQELNRTWANVLYVYQHRADLIPNLVNTVSGAANFEKSTLVEVTNARASVGRVQVQLDPNKAPTDAAQLEQFENA